MAGREVDLRMHEGGHRGGEEGIENKESHGGQMGERRAARRPGMGKREMLLVVCTVVCTAEASEAMHAMVGLGGGGLVAAPLRSDMAATAFAQEQAYAHGDQAVAQQQAQASKPHIIRRVNSHPILRVKSFGELSSIEYEDLVTQLRTATVAGDIDQVFALVKQGAWPNHQRVGTSLQTNALQLAAVNGRDELIELLVHLGADVNLKNNQAMTALHMASQLGLIKVVKALVALGADAMALDWMNESAADKAGLSGQLDVVSFLRQVELQERASLSAYHHHVHADMMPKKEKFYV